MPESAGSRLAPALKLTSPLLGTTTPQSSHSSDSGGSDLDLDLTDSKVFPRGELRADLGGPVPQHPATPDLLSTMVSIERLPVDNCPHLLLTFQPLLIDGFPDYKKGEPKHGKRKRGRPRKLSKEYWDCLEGKKSKHGKF